jgi:Carbohydrate binding module (family 6).
VNPSGNINNGIRFSNVGITSAGNYRLTIAYISKDTRNFKLIVNGIDLSANSNFSVLPSGNWCFETNPRTADWHRVIALNAGSNTIEIKTISSNGNTNAPFFDKISLVREFASYEAEQARLTGDVAIETCNRASNGLNVNLKTSAANSISFDNVFVDESATYFVDFHYVSKVARSARIIINGVVETISFEASGNWCYETGPSNAPKVKSLLRALNAGVNRIEIKTTGTDAPLIDKISILKQPSKALNSARTSESSA